MLYLVDDNLLTDKDVIRDMWADHFEVLGTPSENDDFDSDFLTSVADTVQELLISFSNDPDGPLCVPLRYEEVAFVCSRLNRPQEAFVFRSFAFWRQNGTSCSRTL